MVSAGKRPISRVDADQLVCNDRSLVEGSRHLFRGPLGRGEVAQEYVYFGGIRYLALTAREEATLKGFWGRSDVEDATFGRRSQLPSGGDCILLPEPLRVGKVLPGLARGHSSGRYARGRGAEESTAAREWKTGIDCGIY